MRLKIACGSAERYRDRPAADQLGSEIGSNPIIVDAAQPPARPRQRWGSGRGSAPSFFLSLTIARHDRYVDTKEIVPSYLYDGQLKRNARFRKCPGKGRALNLALTLHA
jgi:hypothetical protein